MSLPTIYEPSRPRADVLEDRVRDEDFPAGLSQVLKGIPELKEPRKVEGLGGNRPVLIKGAVYWLSVAMPRQKPRRFLAGLRLLLSAS